MEPVKELVVEPIVEPVVEPISEPIMEPVKDPIVKQVQPEPVSSSTENTITQTVLTPKPVEALSSGQTKAEQPAN